MLGLLYVHLRMGHTIDWVWVVSLVGALFLFLRRTCATLINRNETIRNRCPAVFLNLVKPSATWVESMGPYWSSVPGGLMVAPYSFCWLGCDRSGMELWSALTLLIGVPGAIAAATIALASYGWKRVIGHSVAVIAFQVVVFVANVRLLVPIMLGYHGM